MNFKDKLRAKRKIYTQTGLAKRMNCSQVYISKVLTGKTKPTLKFAKKLNNLIDKL